MRLVSKMQSNKAKRLAIVAAVTLAVDALGEKIVYDKIVHRYDAQNACINHLVWIAGAKKVAAQEFHLKPGAILNQRDLNKYIIGDFPKCPGGGINAIN